MPGTDCGNDAVRLVRVAPAAEDASPAVTRLHASTAAMCFWFELVDVLLLEPLEELPHAASTRMLAISVVRRRVRFKVGPVVWQARVCKVNLLRDLREPAATARGA